MDSKKITISIVVLVVIAIGYFAVTSPQNDALVTEVSSEQMNEEALVEAGAEAVDGMDSGVAEIEMESEMMDDDMSNETASGPGVYTEYSEDKLAMADDGDVVLFFHATWCPTCRSLDADITANADAIPSDLTLLKTDYDTSGELRRKYGVTRQHTMVQVDAAGDLIKKWDGGQTLSSVLEDII